MGAENHTVATRRLLGQAPGYPRYLRNPRLHPIVFPTAMPAALFLAYGPGSNHLEVLQLHHGVIPSGRPGSDHIWIVATSCRT